MGETFWGLAIAAVLFAAGTAGWIYTDTVKRFVRKARRDQFGEGEYADKQVRRVSTTQLRIAFTAAIVLAVVIGIQALRS